MFRFASPYSFFLLLPTALAALCVFRKRPRAGLLFAPAPRVPPRHRGWRAAASLACAAAFVASLVLAITALARPQTVLSRSHRRADAVAIQMVMDVSGSMEALDMSEIAGNVIVREQTRLDVVKDTFADFVTRRPDDLIGLVTFGGYASTRAPLTPDHDALLHVLKGVEVPKPFQDGSGRIVNPEEMLTAIGDALATACARLQKAELKSRLVVLLSDGESNTGIIKPEAAAEAAAKLKIRVYTIGVGSTGWAPFRTRDMLGRSVVQRTQVSLDEALLRKIADTTGGRYFHVRDPRGLQKALEDIDRLEKTVVEKDMYYQYHELFGRLLLPAVALAFLATGLNTLVGGRVV